MEETKAFLRYLNLSIKLDLGEAKISGTDLSSAFRGLFGRALKDSFCIQRNLNCQDCSLDKCLYRIIFEDDQTGYEQFRPYIIRHLDSDQSLATIELTLLGSFVDKLSSIVHTILRISDWQLKLGPYLHQITIKEITDSRQQVIYSDTNGLVGDTQACQISFVPEAREYLHLEFISPLRMKNEGKLMSRFEWKAFLRNLYHRVSFIDSKFNDNALSLPPIWEDSPEVKSRMFWQERPRLSYRQMQKMSLGGLLGYAEIINPSPQTVALLKLGEITHAGKQTSFGLGKYTMS